MEHIHFTLELHEGSTVVANAISDKRIYCMCLYVKFSEVKKNKVLCVVMWQTAEVENIARTQADRQARTHAQI